MRVALNQVKEGAAQACISAGNTGALMAVSRLCAQDAARHRAARDRVRAAEPDRLHDDAGPRRERRLRAAASAAVRGDGARARRRARGQGASDDRPAEHREEVIKGNETIKRAGELLRASTLNFRGNVEGNDIYKGTVDVIVCDGFVGNVALKTSEGLAQMLSDIIREEFGRSLMSKLMALLALPVLMRFKKRVDHRQYNGAALLGLKGLVIKSHGSADAYAFEWAIKRGYDAVKNGVLERLARAMADNSVSLGDGGHDAGGAGTASPAPGHHAEPSAAQSSKA